MGESFAGKNLFDEIILYIKAEPKRVKRKIFHEVCYGPSNGDKIYV